MTFDRNNFFFSLSFDPTGPPFVISALLDKHDLFEIDRLNFLQILLYTFFYSNFILDETRSLGDGLALRTDREP